MRTINIRSRVYTLDAHAVLSNWPDEKIKNEPMLFNCDFENAFRLGGPLTHAALTVLPKGWQDDVVVDSRVHMLMPGFYPCIPGWHHDDVPRTRRDGQPNYEYGQDCAEHIMLLFNAHLAPTQFAVGSVNFPYPGDGELGGKAIYGMWSPMVDELIATHDLSVITVQDGRWMFFDDRSWHRGVQASAFGWRFFIRVSRYYDKDGNRIARRNKRTNEIRRQVQIYMPTPDQGW